MPSSNGNPSMDNLSIVLGALRKRRRVRLASRAVKSGVAAGTLLRGFDYRTSRAERARTASIASLNSKSLTPESDLDLTWNGLNARFQHDFSGFEDRARHQSRTLPSRFSRHRFRSGLHLGCIRGE